jgi:hypothetical protein
MLEAIKNDTVQKQERIKTGKKGNATQKEQFKTL